jgi:hypothetical protein
MQIKNQEIDLWDDAIKWHPYTHDLIDGINLVADVAVRSPEEADQEAFSGIHIVGNYVIGADDNFWRVSRYRLSSSMPFNITLPPRGIKNVFRQLSGRKLRRIAEVETVDDGKVSTGMAFDFGDVRVWIPRVELKEENTCDEMERGGGFITFGRNYVVSGVNMIFNEPCNFVITISSALREKIPIAIKDGDGKTSPLAITFKKGKIHFLYRNEKFSSKGKVLMKDCMPEHPVIARVDYNHFVQALRGKRLMGLIQFRGNKFLYFKNKKLEHLLKAQ